MSNRPTTIERAYQLAESGECRTVSEVKQRLAAEGYDRINDQLYGGTVTAADDWDAPAQSKRVRPALPGSYEALFHSTGSPRFMLFLRERGLPSEVYGPRLQRAIGVIYRPETERQSHYFDARLVEQFDAMIHIDETRALQALSVAQALSDEPPETYPTAM